MHERIVLKDQVRVCGIDDSPFEFGNRSAKATVIGAVVRVPSYLEGVIKFEVSVDGDDSTEAIRSAVGKSRFKDQIRALMIDGIALAGFNVIEIQELADSLGIPVITVTRDKPDMEAIRAALSKYFDDWKSRYEKITRIPMKEMQTPQNPIYVSYAGIDWEEAGKLIDISTVRGAIPEPLRMAHIIASGIVRGESKGKA